VALLDIFHAVSIPIRFWLNVLSYTVNFAKLRPHVLEHLWSLSVEEQFYLLWPLVVRIGSLRTCVGVAILAILASPVAHGIQRLSGTQFPHYAFPFVCGPLAMGCLLGVWAGKARRAITSSKLLSDSRTVFVSLVLIAFLTTLFDHDGALTVFINIVTDFLLAFCVARFVFIPMDIAGRILNSTPLVLLGKLSYSLYLWQQLFMLPVLSGQICTFPDNLVATFAIASVSYWGLEVKFQALRKKFRNRQHPSHFCPSETHAAMAAKGGVSGRPC
jgi:peptidoglycan/LPS O-acetylase OafA/YrhL